jgi:hypothetical protein
MMINRTDPRDVDARDMHVTNGTRRHVTVTEATVHHGTRNLPQDVTVRDRWIPQQLGHQHHPRAALAAYSRSRRISLLCLPRTGYLNIFPVNQGSRPVSTG